MSMMSNAGSSAAANDIMRYIEKLIEEEGLEEFWRAYEIALKIHKYAAEIKQAADSDWY